MSFSAFFHYPIKNPNGAVRDHMFSCKEGFLRNIDVKIISHPANCQIITHIENCSKGIRCSITLEELLEKIKNWE